ncbi:hypothetical protein [Microbacterium dauci]|uniref:Holin n=1 Tax=Microbacterium dauci TaxID=3048008 RepID=A0ABT6ZAQ9_9MICO|nr:hypothetical protein [Microbacterium sp. LX3-4]MDJ1113247.1 hypothetical protein [Microbacterium sp. LX3-4]
MKRLWRASIWHPDAIPPDEFKYRSLKRVWLPIYDGIAVGAGLWAAAFGSPLLHSLLEEQVIDVMGILLAAVATVCFLGVAFPGLWKVEIGGKVTLMALLGAYAFAVAVFRTNPDPAAGFVAFVIALGIPLPLFRLTLLGEEIKERRGESDPEEGAA